MKKEMCIRNKGARRRIKKIFNWLIVKWKRLTILKNAVTWSEWNARKLVENSE